MKSVTIRWVGMAIAASVCVSMIALAAEADSTAEKQRDIRRLMVLTGAGDLGIQVTDQMLASFKESLPQVPDTFWQEFRKDINANALIDLCVPVYEKHLSHSDIKEMIRFYETPAGKRVVKALPLITQESMLAGQKWGQDIAQKAVEKLQKSGYK